MVNFIEKTVCFKYFPFPYRIRVENNNSNILKKYHESMSHEVMYHEVTLKIGYKFGMWQFFVKNVNAAY